MDAQSIISDPAGPLFVFTAVISTLAAVISTGTAFKSYKLTRSIQRDAKSDEKIFVGKIEPPRDSRRLFGLSQAATATGFSSAR